MANQWQKGHRCGKAAGNQLHQKPLPMGIVVRSTNQRWLGYLEVTTRPVRVWASFCGGGAGFSWRIRPTVDSPMCKPARDSVWAILTFPIVGQSTFNRWTR